MKKCSSKNAYEILIIYHFMVYNFELMLYMCRIMINSYKEPEICVSEFSVGIAEIPILL